VDQALAELVLGLEDGWGALDGGAGRHTGCQVRKVGGAHEEGAPEAWAMVVAQEGLQVFPAVMGDGKL
jgi:hypothetical protein